MSSPNVRSTWENTGNGINPHSMGESLEFHYPKALCPMKASKITETGNKTAAASEAEMSHS